MRIEWPEAVPYHPKASIHNFKYMYNGNGVVVVDAVLVMSLKSGVVLVVLEDQRLAMLLRVLVFICYRCGYRFVWRSGCSASHHD